MAFPTTFTKSGADVTAASFAQKLQFKGVHVGKSVAFLAFLTSFTQSFTSTWNSEQVYGRTDPIGTFQGNQRTLALTWDIPSGSTAEAKENLQRMGDLIKLIYPTYVGTGNTEGVGINALTLASNPLLRIKYANLVEADSSTGLLGYITAITWTPVLDMGFFEAGVEIYPKVVSLNISFNVLHEQDIAWKGGEFSGGTFPFGG